MDDLKDTTKKPYIRPQIFRVRLEAEQAVLGTCSASFADPQDSNPAGTGCFAGGCKAKSHGHGGDSAASS